MKSNKSLFAAALMTGVCVLALSACDTMDSAWNDVTGDSTPYAGDIQPQNNQQAAMPQTQQPMQPQQMAMAQPVIPPTALQPTYQQQPGAAPNLAVVPARPTVAEMPSAQQVQMARTDLTNDNRAATGYLRDPHAPAAPAAMPMAATTQPMMMGSAPMMMAGADGLLGLQATAPGRYALTPLAPEAPLGGFSLASSLMYPPGNDQVSMPQYQELRRVAGQYTAQPGRVRVVSYGDAQNPQALQRATTAAAYLVDLGVPANAIRVKLDNSAGAQPMSKTDIFLETPAAK